MKTEKEIHEAVAETLALADGIDQVAPPFGLKAKVLARMNAAGERKVRPIWLRPALAAAAAVAVIALNWVTITHFVASRHESNLASNDPIDAIRMEYSLTEIDI
jgi:hypothetical protein